MTTINRLGIEGIRSYGPGKEQTITFTPPLTLILGANGSGKTTIIEALRMATCGALPPNSGSGQAFVHDPRVSFKESTETKGKIRLRFVDNNGYSHTVSRLFSLTNKKVKGGEGSKQQYKQSEGSIETKLIATGEKSTITNKCAQIDQLVPELMGVSQAVLQNVIFCHQEESNWILGDPKTLKDKFDSIFASTRYSKALDHIKLTLKSLKEEIKDYEKEEAGQKVHKQHAHEFTQKLRGFEHQENTEKKQKIELEEEIKQLTLKQKKLQEGLEKWKGSAEHQKESNQKIKGHEEHLASTLDKIKEEIADSDEELLKEKRENEKKLKDAAYSKRKVEEEILKAKTAQDECRQSLDHNQRGFSTLQVKQGEMKSNEVERINLAEKIAEEFRLDKTLVPVPFEKVPSTFYRELKSKHDEKKTKLDKRMKENGTQKRDIQEKLDEANREYDREKQTIEHTEKTIKDKSGEAERLRREIETLNYDEHELKRLEETSDKHKLNFKDAMLNICKSAQSAEEFEREVGAQNKKLEQKKVKKMEVQKELKARENERDGIAILKKKKEDLEQRKKDVQAVLAREQHALEEVLGHKAVLNQVSTLTEALKKEVLLRREKLDNAKEEHMEVKTNLKQLEATLSAKDAERNQLRTKMTDLIEAAKNETADGEEVKGLKEAVMGGVDSLDQLITKIETKREKGRTTIEFQKHLEKVLDMFGVTVHRDQCCPLCQRGLHPGSSEMSTYEDKILALKQLGTEDSIKKERAQVENLTAQIDALKSAKKMLVESGEYATRSNAVYDEVDKLKTRIVEVEKQVQDAADYEKRRQEELDKAEEADKVVQEMDLVGFDKLNKSIESDEADMDKRKTNARTAMTIENELRDLEKDVEDLDCALQELRNQQQKFNTETMKFQKSNKEISDKINDQKRKKDSHDEKNARKAEVAREIQKLKDENTRRQEQLPAVEDKKKKIKRELDLQDDTFEKEQRKTDHEINDMLRRMIELEALEKKIADFKQENLEKKLDTLKRQIQEEKDKLKDHEEDLASAKAKLDQNDLGAIEVFIRELDDNLEIRELRRKIAALQEDQAAREDETRHLPSQKELEVLASTIHKDITEKNNQVNQKIGTLKSLEDQIKDHKKKLAEKEYLDIDKKYKKTQIAIETHRGACKDLDKYYTALDNALMRFHEMKMQEINKYIKEYWQTTYKNDDIESIEIKADPENTGNRRSHNYRLVMRHSTLQELDMRGRCSAGQKVLASLVVRLALAETFCHNCGVLALDEPTSNLDERNIKGFTEALGRIVNERKKARNSGFQLIVISHDNEFIDDLARLTEVPDYFRVKKHEETQYSEVEVFEVNDL